jgi:hypothetical protein
MSSTILHLLWIAFQTTHSSPLPLHPRGASIPVGNITQLNEQIAPAWMPPARVRGTLDILYDCLFTMTLCVYTAIHINVPPRGASPKWRYLRKVKWTIVGLFAPEIVLLTAWIQFRQAMRLRKDLNNEVKKPARNQKQGASMAARLPTRRLG